MRDILPRNNSANTPIIVIRPPTPPFRPLRHDLRHFDLGIALSRRLFIRLPLLYRLRDINRPLAYPTEDMFAIGIARMGRTIGPGILNRARQRGPDPRLAVLDRVVLQNEVFELVFADVFVLVPEDDEPGAEGGVG